MKYVVMLAASLALSSAAAAETSLVESLKRVAGQGSQADGASSQQHEAMQKKLAEIERNFKVTEAEIDGDDVLAAMSADDAPRDAEQEPNAQPIAGLTLPGSESSAPAEPRANKAIEEHQAQQKRASQSANADALPASKAKATPKNTTAPEATLSEKKSAPAVKPVTKNVVDKKPAATADVAAEKVKEKAAAEVVKTAEQDRDARVLDDIFSPALDTNESASSDAMMALGDHEMQAAKQASKDEANKQDSVKAAADSKSDNTAKTQAKAEMDTATDTAAETSIGSAAVKSDVEAAQNVTSSADDSATEQNVVSSSVSGEASQEAGAAQDVSAEEAARRKAMMERINNRFNNQ